ncbi:predicted protein [Arabidopsis lyrata subsp. lyrata]|uniref:Predicted protein n=1 Tax=Arabidopsis lyrata subsp. lyrata TaxID=81972 RepID=D7MWV7_ARALL|nr:predicted protein [Arabidopsis lyrata subsp. lyrata]
MTSESATSPAIRPPQVEQPPPQEIPVISEHISAAPPSPAAQITINWLLKNHPFTMDEYEETTTIDGETICSSVWPCARWYADPDASFLDPPQCIEEEEEDEVEEMEEVEEVEEEVEEVGDVEEEQEEVIDSASAEIPNGEISNGGTVLEDTCDVGKKPDMPI